MTEINKLIHLTEENENIAEIIHKGRYNFRNKNIDIDYINNSFDDLQWERKLIVNTRHTTKYEKASLINCDFDIFIMDNLDAKHLFKNDFRPTEIITNIIDTLKECTIENNYYLLIDISSRVKWYLFIKYKPISINKFDIQTLSVLFEHL